MLLLYNGFSRAAVAVTTCVTLAVAAIASLHSIQAYHQPFLFIRRSISDSTAHSWNCHHPRNSCSLQLQPPHYRSVAALYGGTFSTTATILTAAFATMTMEDNDEEVGPGRDEKRDPLTVRGLPTPLLLGSASFSRKVILREMNIPFHVLVRPIDEKNCGNRLTDPPDHLVMTLANAKMDHLLSEIQAGRCKDDLPSLPFSTSTLSSSSSSSLSSSLFQSWIVLTADQVVTCQDSILEKPESIKDARWMVSQYVTYPPSTVGACVVAHWPSGIRVSGVDTATIHFAPTLCSSNNNNNNNNNSIIDPKNDCDDCPLVDEMIQAGEPILSCAGGLMIEHPSVQRHLIRIDGTQDSVIGLSKSLVLQLLDELVAKLRKENEEA